ncbi:GNAT family N-acetyltransferase [Nocardia terpenica]|uniref:GNAT family N-acetyltransferase n=1 Tax=Nocardia terpenica TaxID=455432 RepID=UPI001895C450|nr:GNAT family N-acetyltransferase [Nocardia terpenica]MBF6059203.1 GNAT family N-acetyltransferase [Nocardia terpenica]MBF6103258.1 GNAT family N-acetyltransferase [Nocardia terpenica]MBF6110553.1 GNAT family N-acetyltransferase [Nocardia terpenica]MBF6116684.1 GNAT family N-acetyltransferase [Nocardia terpenica]
MAVDIEALTGVDEEIVEAFDRLLPQLSRSAERLDREALARLVSAESTTVLVARSGGRIVGTLTLVMFRLPSGLRARIEDVVVDSDARGRGIGAALTTEAMARAAAAGARTVDLTSRASRVAANRLYERLGFQSRESQVYRYSPHC